MPSGVVPTQRSWPHREEVRASWTAEGTDLDKHLLAFLEVLGNAAGLPPPGIHLLGSAGQSADPGA